jgi:hypothetical protein
MVCNVHFSCTLPNAMANAGGCCGKVPRNLNEARVSAILSLNCPCTCSIVLFYWKYSLGIDHTGHLYL